MKSKGTNRHDFDPQTVLKLLKNESLSHKDALRILENSCCVVTGLRKDLTQLVDSLKHHTKTRSFWLGD